MKNIITFSYICFLFFLFFLFSGSGDVLCMFLYGTRDPETCALHIIKGKQHTFFFDLDTFCLISETWRHFRDNTDPFLRLHYNTMFRPLYSPVFFTLTLALPPSGKGAIKLIV